jgi:uroporphyrinogen III methyltransferase/synthase
MTVKVASDHPSRYDMFSPKGQPLAGKRILVPPARPEANPLLHILSRRGAEALEFPAVKVAPPKDYGPIDRAIQRLKGFDCVIFSGSNCVINFLERLEVLDVGKAALSEPKIVAIGHGAVSALKKEAIKVHYVPKLHTAEGVAACLGGISDWAFLLVRVEGASRNLPKRLKSLGARVTEVAGYRMLVEATADMAEKVFGWKLDALALANPTAVRFFLKGAEKVGLKLDDSLKDVTIAAVGPTTAEEAGRYGLKPDIISKGHIADLAESLTQLFSKQRKS